MPRQVLNADHYCVRCGILFNRPHCFAQLWHDIHVHLSFDHPEVDVDMSDCPPDHDCVIESEVPAPEISEVPDVTPD
jgi:hypothetical protein